MAALVYYFVLLLVGEVTASWWIWTSAPTDSLRVWYPSFWSFEAGRLHYWSLIFVAVCVVAALIRLWIRSCPGEPRSRKKWLIALSAVLALGLETATSAVHWRSDRASDLRALYHSLWYWDHYPRGSELGWPSFQLFLRNHLIAWVVVLLLGLILWRFWHARTGGRTAK